MTDFQGGFFEAFWKKGLGNGLKFESCLGEAVGQANRKSTGDFGRSYSMALQDVGESLGIRVLSRTHPFFLLRKVQALVDPSGPAGSVDF